MDEKMLAVLKLVVAGSDIVEACRLCGYENPEKASRELMEKEEFIIGLDETIDPNSDILVNSAQARKRFWARVIGDKELPVKERLRASELLSKASGDFTEKVEVTFSPRKLLEAIDGGDRS